MNKSYFGNSIFVLGGILLVVLAVFAVFPFVLLLDAQQKVIFTLNIFSNISGVSISVFLTFYFLDKYFTYEKRKDYEDKIIFLDKKINDFLKIYCKSIGIVFDLDFTNIKEYINIEKESKHYLYCLETHMNLIDQFENRYDCLKEILNNTDKQLLKEYELSNTTLDEISRVKHKLNYFDFDNLIYLCGNIIKHLISLPADNKIKEAINYFEEIEKNLYILKQNVLNNQNEIMILKHFRSLSLSMINFCKKLEANEYDLG